MPSVSVHREALGGVPVAIVSLNHGKANSFDTALCHAVTSTIDDLESSGVEGLILTSTLPLFSGGVDMRQFVSTEEDFREFWFAFLDMCARMYVTPLATVAALNGHCYAGGTVLAMTMDHRMMVDNPKCRIGMNENKVGIIAPEWVCALTSRVIGEHKAQTFLTEGKVVSPGDAIEVGLIDALSTPESLLQAAKKTLKNMLAVPNQESRRETKNYFRRHAKVDLFDRKSELTDTMWKSVASPQAQTALRTTLEKMQRKSKAKL